MNIHKYDTHKKRENHVGFPLFASQQYRGVEITTFIYTDIHEESQFTYGHCKLQRVIQEIISCHETFDQHLTVNPKAPPRSFVCSEVNFSTFQGIIRCVSLSKQFFWFLSITDKKFEIIIYRVRAGHYHKPYGDLIDTRTPKFFLIPYTVILTHVTTLRRKLHTSWKR